MVTIKDGCGCDPCGCDWKQKLKEAYARASVSVNKVGDFDGAIYYPDGSGFVKLPIPKLSEVQQISTNAQDIADLKVADAQLQANITAEETARKAKNELLDADIIRIDSTDTEQDQKIQDNADRITSTYNDLVSTEATVATHDSEIITLQANNQALAKSLVSDVIMTDGTTAGSVQVSIEREDGALVTSANYKWGRDIGVRLEAGTQAGYIKTVISLSDGTELESNEYKIVEVLESDVYVTAITLVPDMTAGTIGGNISYSNGTTQTINAVNVPTAPGVTSAIEALQSRMTAVEQKNATQDATLTAIDGRVQALENTPGIGQFANGRLGTIAGSTTDGRIAAESDGTGSVNGWSDLKTRVTTAERQIVAAQGDITDLDRMVAGKVDIMQGAANAGKALVVGSDGNITPREISSGEVWEEVDLSNWPTDWVAGDRIKVWVLAVISTINSPNSWSEKPTSTNTSFEILKNTNPNNSGNSIIESEVTTKLYSNYNFINIIDRSDSFTIFTATVRSSVSELNSGKIARLDAFTINGGGSRNSASIIVTSSNVTSYIGKIWRKRA